MRAFAWAACPDSAPPRSRKKRSRGNQGNMPLCLVGNTHRSRVIIPHTRTSICAAILFDYPLHFFFSQLDATCTVIFLHLP